MAEEDNFDDEEEIILSELNDEELTEQMHDDLYNGLKEEIEEGTNILLERGWNWCRVHRQDRHWHCERRHTRHWQESGGHDARRCRL